VCFRRSALPPAQVPFSPERAHGVMTDHGQPAPAPEQADRPPAITQTERERSGPLGPEDTDAGPEGAYPDPDEYAGSDDH
jgi:hypothetical protein